MTGIQLFVDYRDGLNTLEYTVENIRLTRTPSLTESLWSYDATQVEQQLLGIASVTDVAHAAVVDAGDLNHAVQGTHSQRLKEYRFALVRTNKSENFEVGTLVVKIGLDGLYAALTKKAALVLLTNSIKSLAVGVFILFIYQWRIGRHIDHIARFAILGQEDQGSQFLPRLNLDRQAQTDSPADELTQVESALNKWLASIDEKTELVQSANKQIELQRDELAESNLRLESANYELSHFAYSASHDLKAPLGSIMGMLDFSESDIRNGSPEDALVTIKHARDLTNTLSGRIEDMLVLARSDQDYDDVVSLNVRDVIADTWAQTQAQYPGRQANLTSACQHIDPVRLAQTRFKIVIENLMSNAFKYASPHRDALQVDIKTSTSNSHLLFSISDNGIGIPDKFHPKVFGMFQRFADSKQPGSGLGLAIVKKNIVHMGGEVTFTSTPCGTTFSLNLPLASE